MSVVVTLTVEEIEKAATVGVQRHCNKLRKSWSNSYGVRDLEWQIDIEGAIAELAVAKWAGLPWNGSVGVPDYDGDVGRAHVRSTSHHHGRLILHDSDADGAAFILVTGTAPRLRLEGWLFAKEGKRPEYLDELRSGGKSYFVPQSKLRPITNKTRILERCKKGMKGFDENDRSHRR